MLLLHPPLDGFKFSRLVLYGWMAALHKSQLLGRGALLSKLYEKDRLQRAPERILLLEFRRNETNASKLTGNLMHGSHYLFGNVNLQIFSVGGICQSVRRYSFFGI